MSMLVWLAAFAVHMQDAAPPSCGLVDNECRAALFAARARTAKTLTDRANYLEAACNSLVALHRETGRARHLCAARRTFESLARIVGDRSRLADLRKELEQQESSARPECGERRSRGSQRKAVAQVATSDPAEPIEAKPEEELLMPARASSPAPAATLPDEPQRPIAATTPARSSTVLDNPAVERPSPRPPRRLVIAGGVLLGTGIGLVGVAGYAGGRVADASRASFDLYADSHGQGDADALAREAALRREHGRWLPVTVATAAIGGATLVVGAVLVGVGSRRLTRLSRRAALLPAPGGLVVRARF